MLLEINIFKNHNWWLSEIKELDVFSQGHTKREATIMIKDAIEALLNEDRLKLEVLKKDGKFYIYSESDEKLIALILKRQRYKFKLTLQEVAHRLGSNSPNAFARYEQGKSKPTLFQLRKLLKCLNPEAEIQFKIC